jgi:uncharacterized OB-fold protein
VADTGPGTGPDRGRPTPAVTPDTAPFYDAAAAGRLVIQGCAACGRLQHPPGPLCRSCGATDLGYRPVSGRARLWSWTVARVSFAPGFDQALPYLIACAELVEQAGLLMLSHRPRVSTDDIARLAVGAPMHAVFPPGDGPPLVEFAFDDPPGPGAR